MRWLVPLVPVVFGCGRPAPVASAVSNVALPARGPENLVHVAGPVLGYFRASTSPSRNAPRPNGDTELRPGLYARVYLDENATLPTGRDAIRVVIANNLLVPITFAVQDERLYVVQEAKRRDGTWVPIEYLTESWCMTSIGTLALPAGMHWQFLAPRYGGSFATTLRVAVSLDDTASATPRWFYSNEFAGSVDPAQLVYDPLRPPIDVMRP